MRKIFRFMALAFSSALICYSAFSIVFVEYLILSDRMLGYYWTDTIRSPQLYLNAADGRKISLYSTDDGTSYWSGVRVEFSNRFLFPLDPRASKNEYLFSHTPSKNPITDKPLLLVARSNKKFEHVDSYRSDLSWVISDMTFKFWPPKNFKSFFGTIYYWRRWDELMEVVGNGKNLLTIWLSDTRIMDDYGDVITLIPKKRSPLLLISRVGFFKKVWHSE